MSADTSKNDRHDRVSMFKRWLPPAAAVALVLGLLLLIFGRPHRGDPDDLDRPVSPGPAAIVPPGQICIALDPGHGGEAYPGCVFDDAMEKDLNLALAQRVKTLLEGRGYPVVMTRDNDSEISLGARSAIAEEAGADVFVSIHHNSLENNTVTSGIEIWRHDGNNPENSVLAQCILDEMLRRTGALDRGLKPGEKLVVLQPLTMPACLVEVGFLSSIQERALLLNPEYQEKLAQGIAAGIRMFLNARS